MKKINSNPVKGGGFHTSFRWSLSFATTIGLASNNVWVGVASWCVMATVWTILDIVRNRMQNKP